MIKIDGIGDRRRLPRYQLEERVRVRVRSGEVEHEHEGRLKDVSGGGALLDLGVPLENDVFVELHVEGLGRLPGRVVRGRENEIAVKFTIGEEEEERIARKIEKINIKV